MSEDASWMFIVFDTQYEWLIKTDSEKILLYDDIDDVNDRHVFDLFRINVK